MFGLTPWKKERKNGSRELATRTDNPLLRLRDEFDTLFDRFFGNVPAPWGGDWGGWGGLGLDVEDQGKEVVVRAEAPGFEAEEFDVQVSGNVLTIRAEQKHEEGKEGEQRYVSRRRSFHRTFTLPAGVTADNVQARYRNGVLEVRLPKSEEALPKRIEVKG